MQTIDALINGTPYSHSRLFTYVDCALRYYYHYVLRLEPIMEYVSPPLAFGSLMHECLAAYYKGNHSLADALLKLDELEDEGVLPPPVGEKYGHLTYFHAELILRNYDEFWKDDGVVPVAVIEEPLEGTVSGYPFTGIPDLLYRVNGDDVLRVMDHKTTNSYLGDILGTRTMMQHQLRLYAILAKQNDLGDVEVGVSNGIYVGKYATSAKSKAKKFYRWPYAYTPAHLQDSTAWVGEVALSIMESELQNRWPSCPDARCDHCPFQILCTTPSPLRKGAQETNFKVRPTSEGD